MLFLKKQQNLKMLSAALQQIIDGALWAGFILAQNDDRPLKWANGPYPIQIHANFQILMGHLKFLWALCKI